MTASGLYTDDREGRSRRVRDMAAPAGLASSDDSAWLRAVEWFENRPSSGASPGERLLWCLVRNRAVDFISWADLDDEQRDTCEAMAATLREHGGRR